MTAQIAYGTRPQMIGGNVHFTLAIKGEIQKFEISRQALADHFGDHGRVNDILAAFKRGQARIFETAEAKHGGRPTNVINLVSADF